MKGTCIPPAVRSNRKSIELLNKTTVCVCTRGNVRVEPEDGMARIWDNLSDTLLAPIIQP